MSRDYLHSFYSLESFFTLSLCSRNLGKLLLLFPAMFCGCSPEVLPEAVSVQTEVRRQDVPFDNTGPVSQGSTLDILIFENDPFLRLDSYKRVESLTEAEGVVESTGGDKRMFFCLNGQRERLDWADISSYHSLSKIYCDLEKERRGQATMTGECSGSAGMKGLSVIMKPLVSEVKVDRISCDFSGTSYVSSRLKDVKAYLINVNASYGLLTEDGHGTERMINVEMLSQADVDRFLEKDNIFRHMTDGLGSSVIRPDVSFLCYPHSGDDTSPSTQCTRLVIEGKIGTETYYWPINVNGGIVERANSYIYDIKIRRKGACDPNTPIDPKNIDFVMTTAKWTEEKEYEVTF